MSAFIRYLLVFAIAACAVTYGSLMIFGRMASAQAQKAIDTIIVRDVIYKDTHNLSGNVNVPTPCYQLISRTQEIDVSNFLLFFSTWENPNVSCDRAASSITRPFNMTLFAPPTGISFQGTLNDESVPVQVITTKAD